MTLFLEIICLISLGSALTIFAIFTVFLKDFENISEDRYKAGFGKGNASGYKEGYSISFSEGYSKGYFDGNKEGFDKGLRIGKRDLIMRRVDCSHEEKSNNLAVTKGLIVQ